MGKTIKQHPNREIPLKKKNALEVATWLPFT
jgi:hypothetical protein